MLENILNKYGIRIKNADGTLRNTIDVIEDMYLKLNAHEFSRIMQEFIEEEKYANIFDDARGRPYKGVE